MIMIMASAVDAQNVYGSLEDAVVRLISCTDKLKKQINRFSVVYKLWAPKRKKSISSIREIAAAIDDDHKNVNISNLVGSSVAVVGGGIAIVGFCLLPFTFGASAVLTVTGTAVGFAGGATGAGASVTDYVLQKKNSAKAKEIINSDRDEAGYLAKIVEEIIKLENELEKTAAVFLLQKMNTDKCILGFKSSEGTSALQLWVNAGLSSTVGAIADLLPSCGNLGAKLVTQLSQSITWLMKLPKFVLKLKMLVQKACASRAILAGAGGILAGIGIALALVNIAITAVDVHHGSKTKTAKELYKTADELENELSTATDLFNEIEKKISFKG